MTLDRFLTVILGLFILMAINSGAVNAQNQKPNDKDKKVQKEKEKDDDDDDDDDELDSPEMQKELAKKAKISPEEARRKALARVPGTVIESELDKEKGRVVYEFEIKDKDNKTFDVLVDAQTGEIVGVEADDDENGDDDTKNNLQTKTDKGKWYKFWRVIPGFNKRKT